jgi:hypothetical protein
LGHFVHYASVFPITCLGKKKRVQGFPFTDKLKGKVQPITVHEVPVVV